MKIRAILAAAALVAATGPALAADKKFVSYSISNKRSEVKGIFIVGGYSPAQIHDFISQDCRGQVGQIALTGKPRKKRGHVLQKYKTTCTGGLDPKFKGGRATFEVEKMPDGRTLVEILTSDGAGNMLMLKEYR